MVIKLSLWLSIVLCVPFALLDIIMYIRYWDELGVIRDPMASFKSILLMGLVGMFGSLILRSYFPDDLFIGVVFPWEVAFLVYELFVLTFVNPPDKRSKDLK